VAICEYLCLSFSCLQFLWIVCVCVCVCRQARVYPAHGFSFSPFFFFFLRFVREPSNQISHHEGASTVSAADRRLSYNPTNSPPLPGSDSNGNSYSRLLCFHAHTHTPHQVSKHCFNSSLDTRLWEHLLRCLEMNLGSRPIPPAQVPLLALAILEVFPELPDSVVCSFFPALLLSLMPTHCTFRDG
jgi:hypothetical protein